MDLRDFLLKAKQRAETSVLIEHMSGDSFWMNAVATARRVNFGETQKLLVELSPIRPLKPGKSPSDKPEVVELDYSAVLKPCHL